MENKKKLMKVINSAKEKGITIDIAEPLDRLCSNRQDAMLYHGLIATFTNKEYQVVLKVVGDLRGAVSIGGDLYNFSNTEDFCDMVHPYIDKDKDLYRMLSNEQIKLWDNPWIEFSVINLKTHKEWELDLVSVLDSENVYDAIISYLRFFDFIDQNKDLYESEVNPHTKIIPHIRATCIKWDTDGKEVALPTEVDIPENISEEDVSDYLSDLTGFCHEGYVIVHN